MRELELWLVLASIAGGVLGLWGIILERTGHGLTSWGRGLSVGAIVFLGGGSIFAAFYRAESLVPLGLSAGFLVVGLLWGDPCAKVTDASPASGFNPEHS